MKEYLIDLALMKFESNEQNIVEEPNMNEEYEENDELKIEPDENTFEIKKAIETLSEYQAVPFHIVKEAAFMKYSIESGLYQSLTKAFQSILSQSTWPQNPHSLLLFQLLGSSLM